jgi:SAM-dependent methyltransferase
MPDWTRFYRATAGRPPRATLLRALDLLEAEGTPGFAVDLGCGAGRDTVELLRRGWRVLAVDGEADALARLAARDDLSDRGLLELRKTRFEDAKFEVPPCDLVNASFSIPFVPPAVFRRLWGQIGAAVRPGGCFAGQLLGARDTWAGRAGVTAFARTEAEGLCRGWEIVSFEETEEDSTTVRGTAKHWHLFHLVLRKPGGAGTRP